MKRHSTFYGLLISVVFSMTISGKAQPVDSVFQKKVVLSFQKVINASQEKVYLHTDKPYYFAGDTIWLKAYSVNAITHFMSKGSRYVYVELINRKNKVIQRLKVAERNDMFSSFIALPSHIAEGDYYLRAYTYWMQNAGPDYFFHKNIQIYASQAPFMKTDIRYEQRDDKRIAIITFHKTGGGVFVKRYVDYMVRTKSSENKFRQQQTNKQGEIQIEIPSKEELEQYIYVVLKDGLLRHKQTFFVPEQFECHIDFFPEGGDLIGGTTQKIAFKAINNEGIPIAVKGNILTDSGDTITSFQSLHSGIGNFMLPTQLDKRYKAVVHAKQGNVEILKEFDLPTPRADKLALTVNTRKNIAYYDVLFPPTGLLQKAFYLIGHTRGFILFANRIEPGKRGTIDLSVIPEGILSLVLLDESFIPYSERLVFVKHASVNYRVTSDKASYGPREPVSLDISLQDVMGYPLQGSFSISVTDNHAININTEENNILSHLLLTSDLKGHIDSPGYYFKEDTPRTNACLDNLMLTHGWIRFNIEKLLKDTITPPRYYMEMGQTVSGKVTDFRNKPLIDKQVLIKVNGKSYPPVVTDKNGIFVLNNLAFTDTAGSMLFFLKNQKCSGME